MKPRYILLFVIIFILLLASGCGSDDASSKGGTADPLNVTCEVFYRPDAGMPLEAAPEITFSGGNQWGSAEFERLTFEARFQDDQYEGRALSISITTPDNGDVLTSQLYQFDSKNPPQNQFIGGHGFTGLVYVYHPDSSAEMQYFCNLR
jgi:hypothetical protein